MSKELVISATPHETRVAIMEDGQLCEIYIEREKEFALVGSLYKGRVTRVLPGMQSAFVDIGLDSDAFLYVSDFLEHLEEYDHVAPVEPKIHRPEPGRRSVSAVDDQRRRGSPATQPCSEPVDEPVHPAEPVEAAGAAEAAPVITPLEGETFQVAAAGQPAASDPAASRRPRRCSAASVLLSSKGTIVTADAAALATVADVVGAIALWTARPRWTRRARPPARARFAAVQIRFAVV